MFIPFPLILRSNFPRREVYYTADIKTRDAVKGTIKTIDKATVAGQRMKQAYISTKDKAEHSTSAAENSADEYAADRFERGVDTAVHEGAHQFDKAGRRGVETTKENIYKAILKKMPSEKAASFIAYQLFLYLSVSSNIL